MPNVVLSFIGRRVRAAAQEYLFNSTLDIFAQALAADSTASAAKIVIASASRDNEEFWMDLMVLAVGVLIVIMLVTCAVRVFCWVCVGVPVQAYELDQMAKGKRDFQITARKEREEKRQRQAAGLEEKPIPLAQDMQQLVSAMGEVRSRLKKHGIAVGQPALPTGGVSALAEVYEATNTRSALTHSTPASAIRGFPEVTILLASPSQRYVLVGCRSKRRTILFPQANDEAYMTQGKHLGAAVAAGTLPSVEAALASSMRDDRPPEVYAAAFSSDDARLLVGERGTDTIFAVAISAAGGGKLSPLWGCPLPGKRLVSSLPARWSTVGPDSIVTMSDKDCEVEVISLKSAGGQSSFKDRFKIGTATAWAQRGEQIAVAGSFMREPRLAKLTTRSTGAVVLETSVLFPNPLRARASALALVTKGVPAFNTRSYYVVFFESGDCSVYDLDSLAQSNTPATCASFKDTDYAGFNAKAPLRMFACVAGKAYQEQLLIGLYRDGSKLSVYRQAGHGATFTMTLAVDIHGPQEGGPIREAVFLQNGKGVATCGEDDGLQVRMFAVPQ